MNTTGFDPIQTWPDNSALTADPSGARRWNRFTLFTFRLLFTYLLIYNLAAFLEVAAILPGAVEKWLYTKVKADLPQAGPYANRPAQWLETGMHGVVPHVWSRVPEDWKGGELAKEITVFPNGSGDTTYNYVEVWLYALVALAVTILWMIISRRRANHDRLHGFLRVVLRYVLAVSMLGYGMAKVIPLQMPAPDPYRLTSTYGDSSPMGILWAFIGASKAFSVFAGAGEVLAGLLLLWRRTTTLGAIFAIIVLSNIVAMNFCYDVPVKLYSAHLLLAAIVLLAPQAPRLAAVLLSDRALPATRTQPLCSRRRMHYIWGVAKAGLVMAFMAQQISSGIESWHTYGGGAPAPPLYGLYNVEEHKINGQVEPPLLTSKTRWRDVVVGKIYPWGNGMGTLRARGMGDEMSWYQYKLDTDAKTMALTTMQRGLARVPVATQPAAPVPVTSQLTYREPDADHLVLEGKLGDDDVVLTLVRRPLDKFLLVSRGFHWVNEYPLNR